ncbi:hypothetical protein GCM10009754_39950 [Amycolatopsis minnesotensis]|uniref:Uncharacterized protein n=1 Tax=Amycolatopsis minnesotensis TaxID=337894 RepID=A0ABN2R601_9PSEU
MTDGDARLREYLNTAVASLREANRKLREVTEARHEPIAIVGMSCRYPGGVRTPDELWRLAAEGRDAITPFPADRGWDVAGLYDPEPGKPGRTYVREGGFLHDVAGFDAEFFGISPREALAMDPQQRLLLELSWEAIERGGIDPHALRGTATGVFTGVMTSGYGSGPHEGGTAADDYLPIGTAVSIASGRISYTLGFEGPTLTLDTSCSSSLVALHLAAQALRRGECSLALAGAALVMSTPLAFVEFSRQRALSPDARCKPFAAAANGTAWAEGAGMLLVERLSDAQRLGHPVLAVLKGSAMNSDGASNGLTAPNGLSQRAVIEQALADARLGPADVDVIEAHGTGTTLGDPIEAEALLAAYGRRRTADRPALLGSLKSNIGHAQAAAGVAGVIKLVHGMRHGLVPATLHVDRPTPHVDWDSGALRLVTEPTPWPETGAPKRAAISSFGISGTNAHAIFEEPPARQEDPREIRDRLVPCVLSGSTARALRAQAATLLSRLGESTVDELPVGDIAYSLATGRAALEHRAVLLAEDAAGLRAELTKLADGGSGPVTGSVRDVDLAFAFTGQGSQRAGMGRALAEEVPEFAAAFDEVCALLDPALPQPLREVFFDGNGPVDRTDFAQAGLFALQVALFRTLEAWGVVPEALIGHSIGELAIAHVSGVLSLEDACTLVAARGALMRDLPPGGAMAAIQATAAELEPTLGEHVSIAALNTPSSTVVSGTEHAVAELVRAWEEHGRKVKRLAVGHAFHSALMEPVLAEFRRVAEGLTYRAPEIPVFSTLTGRLAADGDLTTPGYWVRHVREPVRFSDTVRALADGGAGRILELGPDGVLTALARDCLPDDAELIPALRADQPEYQTLLSAVAELHARGSVVDWSAVLSGQDVRRVPLPTYAFQHERFWLGGERPAPSGRYRIEWRPVPIPERTTVDGTWLVIGDGEPHEAVCAEALRRRGATVVTEPEPGLAGVVALRHRDLMSIVDLLRDDAPVWCVTSGAVSAGERVRDPGQAPVWGLGRVAALELPDRWGGLVDLPATVDEAAGDLFAAALVSGEDQVAIRDGLFGRRLVKAPEQTPAPWSPGETVLITGGTGALGAEVAKWLARRGAGHLVLTSRRGEAAPGAAELVTELTELGAGAVTITACDVADRDALAALLAEHPPDSVVHAAGVLDDGVLESLDGERFDRVLAPKVDGARNLHELTGGLRAFVLFSSASSTVGNAGQANYAAANAYLDALAEQRHADGLPATSIAWGAWAAGMADEVTGGADKLRRGGMTPLLPDQAITALDGAIGANEPCLTVANVDWARFAPAFTAARPSPLLAELVDNGPEEHGGAVRLDLLPAAERERAALDLVREQAAIVLGHAGRAAVSPSKPFRELGFDSLTVVELRGRVNAATGARLAPTALFDHPTPAALAAHLTGALTATATPKVSTVDPVGAEADDPIAIIAMSCRFPGGIRTPEQLWDLVAAEGDAISGLPSDRGWDLGSLIDDDPDKPGTTYARGGGFLHDVAEFDAEFFGISPREAAATDPQQRLLLEIAWEAFERAGIDATTVRGSRTGVFAGANGVDYILALRANAVAEGYLGTGGVSSVMSGRIAYSFGLQGPSMTIDTACSASLVALHLAVGSLRRGECSLALAGGATVMSSPLLLTEFSRQRGLAPDGRCKAFAAAADGTGWGEGAGMLLVERLSDARRNGHPVLAIVRGTAVNSDGASNGLTAPNGIAQQHVIEQALADARLAPSEIDAVEAHGTGTKLGDPIEAQALLAAYGQDRRAPLWLGSVKSNIGHTMAAAGIAGVIKMVEAMRHETLPATLHVDAPTPHVDWSAGAVELLTEAWRWDEDGHPRRAGVTSFGISGTNAHVIIEQPEAVPAARSVSAVETTVLPFTVSAHSEAALRAQARQLSKVDAEPADFAYSLATTRAALPHRAVVTADGDGELRAGLAALAAGSAAPGVQTGLAVEAPRLAVLFTGQGSQRAGMAAELAATHPDFREDFDAVVAELNGHLAVPLESVLAGEAESVDDTGYTQPALFAVEVALYRLFERWGVVPSLLAGHSIGELAAAHVAGVLSLEDACALVAARGRLMRDLPGGGAMAALRATEDEVRPLLTDAVALAAVNGPESVVVSGDADAVDELAATFEARGRKVKRLQVSHAFHSPRMDPMLDEFARVAARMTYSPPRIPIVSTVTGRIEPGVATPEYWVRQIREPVRFHDGVRGLAAEGATAYLELGPGGTLASMTRDCLDAPAPAVAALRADRPETRAVTEALGALRVHGVPIDWDAYFAGHGASRVPLPTYAFQPQRHWLPPSAAKAGTGEDPFWTAVDLGDADSLTRTLGLDETARGSLESLLPALAAWRHRKSTVARWRYRVAWRPVPDVAPASALGRWLVLSPPATPLADDCRAALAAHGADVTVAEVDPATPEWPELAGVDGVLSLLALDERGEPVPAGLAATVSLVQSVVDGPRVWCATTGAVSTGSGDRLDSPVQAQLWGLGRVAALELPGRWGGLVDLPPRLDARGGERLAAVLSGRAERETAIRQHGTYVRRLVRPPSGPPARSWRPSGTVLVTGGTGALGAEVTRWLAESGAAHVVVTSRRGEDSPDAARTRAAVAATGAELTIAACDVADRGQLAALLAAHPPTSVFHVAGVLDDGIFDALDPERYATVLRPKVLGGRNLHELTADLDLSAFVLFSSVTATVGSAGQANYAAANAFLDAFAEARRDQGLPATSVAWGPWAGGGMAADGAVVEARLLRGGLAGLSPALAIQALQESLDRDDTVVTVVDVDWPRFGETRPEPLFAEVAEVPAVTGDSAPLRERLASLPVADRAGELAEVVRAQVAAVLGHAGNTAVPLTRPFSELGFDSLTVVELRNQLGAATGVALPSTVVFDHPTPKALACFLADQFGPAPEPAAPPRSAPPPDDTDLDTASLAELLDLVDDELSRS